MYLANSCTGSCVHVNIILVYMIHVCYTCKCWVRYALCGHYWTSYGILCWCITTLSPNCLVWQRKIKARDGSRRLRAPPLTGPRAETTGCKNKQYSRPPEQLTPPFYLSTCISDNLTNTYPPILSLYVH